MKAKTPLLQKAIQCVDEEISQLEAEESAFIEFRDAVSIASPDSDTDVDNPSTTIELREAYQSSIMDTLDYGSLYGSSLKESISQELSPTIAKLLLSEEPITQRRKRQLLVATTGAVERRESFGQDLATERNYLIDYKENILDIKSRVENLPKCTAQNQEMGDLLDLWNLYDSQMERCEELLNQRQRQLENNEYQIPFFDERHALNEYLYNELDTPYPVLAEIAQVCESLESKQKLPQNSESLNQHLQS